MDIPALVFQWDGEVMTPASGFWRREADRHLVIGQRYRMVEENDQSDKSRNHEFAFLKEAWNSFPDHLLEQFPSTEHLRKYGLVRKGFCSVQQYVCKSMREAKRLAATLQDQGDKYALVNIDHRVVTVFKAESQSRRSMGAKRFQESKTALLEFVGDLIGVDPATLSKVEQAA